MRWDSWNESWMSGYSGSIYFWYDNPASGKTGKFTLRIYNKDTGDLLGEASVIIN